MHTTRGGRSLRGGRQSSCKTTFDLAVGSADPTTQPNVPLLPWDPTTPSSLSDIPPSIPSDTHFGESLPISQLHPEENPSLGLRENGPLGNVNVGSSIASTSHDPSPSQLPLLISSVPLLPPSANMRDPVDSHLFAVNKVANVLTSDQPGDLPLEASSPSDSDYSDTIMEPDDNMILGHFQKDIKLEALARRDPSRGSSRSKKGKRNPNP